MNMIPIIIPEALKVTQEQFEALAAANRDVRLERMATGELIIMPPTGGDTGKRNTESGGRGFRVACEFIRRRGFTWICTGFAGCF
jgi:hypothetical protein